MYCFVVCLFKIVFTGTNGRGREGVGYAEAASRQGEGRAGGYSGEWSSYCRHRILIIIIIIISITTVLAQVSVRAGAGEAVTWAGLARSRVARRSVLLGCLLQATQQLAGINTVMYYAASILVMAGLPDTTSIWLAR